MEACGTEDELTEPRRKRGLWGTRTEFWRTTARPKLRPEHRRTRTQDWRIFGGLQEFSEDEKGRKKCPRGQVEDIAMGPSPSPSPSPGPLNKGYPCLVKNL